MFRLARNRLLGLRELAIPSALEKKHAVARTTADFEQSLKDHYFSARGTEYLLTAEGIYDWEDHLFRRLHRARLEIIPWVHEVMTLEGKTVIEVGCGTGSSTVAFAEQGARVIATEIDPASLKVAEHRLSAYGLVGDLRQQNGLPSEPADVILLYAVLEHMTLEERLATIERAWHALKPGGIVVVVETPNRLWFHDAHTSLTTAFHWLPDDLALLYAARTPRRDFNKISEPMQLSRWGRGVSFHDFEIALNCKASELPVVSSLTAWIRRETHADRIGRNELSRRWETLLKELHPDIHHGFHYEYLDLILKKSDRQ